MIDERKLLYQADFPRFVALVRTDDPQARLEGLEENFDDVALCEILRFAIYNTPEMAVELWRFYGEIVMQADEERRWGLYRHAKWFVEETPVAVSAFLPFICQDNALKIVATAVIDYVSLGPISDNDPMTNVKGIIDLITDDNLQNPGAVFGGLVNLGDRRVCRLLLPLRDKLARRSVNDVAKSNTGSMSAATVDFYIDWLASIGTTNDDLYGAVASGLGLHRRHNRTNVVLTGERPFPYGAETTPEQFKALVQPMPLSEYTERIAPRLYALERSEAPPRIMPHILAEWGLEPSTDPSETAPLPSLH